MTLGERIKKVRKDKDLTQQLFAAKIGTTANVLTNYETGRRNPSSSVINNICKTFNVSEAWLRAGEGEMFAPEPAFDLGEYANRHGMTALETEILKAYLDLDPNVREKLLQHFKERLIRSSLVADVKDAPTISAPDVADQARPEPDIAAELAELKRQNQELTAKVAAMKEEDALLGLTDAFSASPSASAGSIRPAQKTKI